MKPTFPDMDLNLDSEALSTSDAARRALDFYLNPVPPALPPDTPWMVPHGSLSSAQAAERATQVLRCAAATACESADGLQGMPRDLALTVVHMINMARTLLEHVPSDHLRS